MVWCQQDRRVAHANIWVFSEELIKSLLLIQQAGQQQTRLNTAERAALWLLLKLITRRPLNLNGVIIIVFNELGSAVGTRFTRRVADSSGGGGGGGAINTHFQTRRSALQTHQYKNVRVRMYVVRRRWAMPRFGPSGQDCLFAWQKSASVSKRLAATCQAHKHILFLLGR